MRAMLNKERQPRTRHVHAKRLRERRETMMFVVLWVNIFVDGCERVGTGPRGPRGRRWESPAAAKAGGGWESPSTVVVGFAWLVSKRRGKRRVKEWRLFPKNTRHARCASKHTSKWGLSLFFCMCDFSH